MLSHLSAALLFFFQQDPDLYEKQTQKEGWIGVLIGIFAMGVVTLYYYLKLKNDYNRPEAFAFTKIREKYKIPLQKYLPYYRVLNPAEKKLFEKRVQKFIDLKTFIPREMEKVTDEMKALIAGAAIQLIALVRTA